MLNFKEYTLLNESKPLATLYHYSSLKGLSQLLTDGYFKLSRHNVWKYKEFYRFRELTDNYKLSMTRNKTFHDKYILGVNLDARIIFNGNCLSQHYHIEPYAWVGNDLNPEFEERLITKNKYLYLKDILHCITGIEIFKTTDEIYLSTLQYIQDKCKEYNIPFKIIS